MKTILSGRSRLWVMYLDGEEHKFMYGDVVAIDRIVATNGKAFSATIAGPVPTSLPFLDLVHGNTLYLISGNGNPADFVGEDPWAALEGCLEIGREIEPIAAASPEKAGMVMVRLDIVFRFRFTGYE